MSDTLAEFPQPPDFLLDLLICAHDVSGPDGSPVRAVDRISEILSRYPTDDPVHRAIERSAATPLAAVARADALAQEGTRRMGVANRGMGWCGVRGSARCVVASTVHVQRSNIFWSCPGNVGALGINARVATDESCVKHSEKLLADFAVGVRDDMARVGVDADEAGDFDVEAGLLLHFTHRGFDDRFAQLHSSWQCPSVVIAPSDEQDASLVVGNDGCGGCTTLFAAGASGSL